MLMQRETREDGFRDREFHVCLATLTMNLVLPSGLPIDDRSVVAQAVISRRSARVFTANHMRSIQVRRLRDVVRVESIFRATINLLGRYPTSEA